MANELMITDLATTQPVQVEAMMKQIQSDMVIRHPCKQFRITSDRTIKKMSMDEFESVIG
jgi:hypothetical protein